MNTIELEPLQIADILEQLRACKGKICANTHIKIKLSPLQLDLLAMNSDDENLDDNRINKNFINKLANNLGLSEGEFRNIIHQNETESIPELADKLNEILLGVIEPPLTQDEVRKLNMMTLPASR